MRQSYIEVCASNANKRGTYRVGFCRTYYFVNDQLKVEGSSDLRTGLDNIRYQKGNYFVTREEAAEYAFNLEIVLKHELN